MSRRLPIAIASVAALAAGLGLRVRAEDPKPEAGSIEALAGPVPVDQFNDDVERKDGSQGRPVRGGSLRIRSPGEPKSLNPMCDNEESTNQIYAYLGQYLCERDRETFEVLPYLARWWAVRDTLLLADGTAYEGRVVKETPEAVVFAPGASRYTFADCDLLRFEPEGGEATRFLEAKTALPAGPGTVVPREGSPGGPALPVVRGTLERPPAGRYTVWVEETPRETVTVPRDQIAIVLEGDEGAQESVPALRREAAFEVHLRPGVRWDDGQPLGVPDVLFSFDTIQNPGVDAPDMRQYFADLERYEQRGEDGVYFRFRRQFFLSFVSTTMSARIYPRHRFQPEQFQGDAEGFARHFNTHKDHRQPVGCGPYRFARWEPSRMIELARNDGWWASSAPGTAPSSAGQPRQQVVPWLDPERPYLDRLRWVFIGNSQAGLKALQEEEVDADFDIEPDTWVEKDVNDSKFTRRFVRAKYLQPLYTYIGWNQDRKGVGPDRQLFRDRRVRLAMSLCIPQDRILDEIHYGLGERVSGPFFKYGPFSDPQVPPVPYALRRAQMLLDDAGWIDHDGDGVRDKDGVQFEFEYLIHNMRDYHQKIADITKEAIERAGVRMVIRKLDWATFLDTSRDQRFDAIRAAWGEPSCIDADPYQIWHSSQSAGRGSNTVSFKDPEADALCLQVRRTLDVRERQTLLRRLHRLLDREQPVTFMFNFHSLYFYARRFRNVRFTVIGETPYQLDTWYTESQ